MGKEDSLDNKNNMHLRIKLGWAATFVWVVIWVLLLSLDWERAKAMAFNEWGDFFAGASAPLAFLWLVIGYFQQGEELSQNTKALEQQEEALKLQVDELKQSVEQQNKSAQALSMQSEITGLMAHLDSINHILETLERQKTRLARSDSFNAPKNIKSITEKQEKYEAAVQIVLEKIESFVEKNND